MGTARRRKAGQYESARIAVRGCCKDFPPPSTPRSRASTIEPYEDVMAKKAKKKTAKKTVKKAKKTAKKKK
jgi:hypothetical protein